MIATTIKRGTFLVDTEGMGWLSSLTDRRNEPRIEAEGDSPPRDRRQSPRFAVPSLSCPIGELVDLSATGMRIICDRKPAVERSSIHKFTICNDHQELPLHGRVVRVRRKGLRSFELGITFVGVDPLVARSIETMAQFGFFSRQSPRDRTAADRAGVAKTRVSAAMPDLYALLNIAHDATADEIQNGYRTMVRRYHPDASQSEQTIDQFQLVHDAYKTLHDPMSRRVYDAMTADWATPAPPSGREG